MKVDELNVEMRKRGLKASGSKLELGNCEELPACRTQLEKAGYAMDSGLVGLSPVKLLVRGKSCGRINSIVRP